MNFTRFLFFGLFSLLTAFTAQAQFEIEGGVENLLDARRAVASAQVSGGTVSGITVRNKGATYSAPPVVIVAAPPSGAGNTTAEAVAVLTGGTVTAITIGNAGSGYTSPPAIFIAPPQTPTGTPTNTPQFAGVASTSATAGAIDSRSVYPSSITAANVDVAGTLPTTIPPRQLNFTREPPAMARFPP